jgi:hypothetical protein
MMMRSSSRKRGGGCGCSVRGMFLASILIAIICGAVVNGPSFYFLSINDDGPEDQPPPSFHRQTSLSSNATPMATVNDNSIRDSRRWSTSNETSACLLVMDDNHFLIEWLAYHYYTTSLRNLIVAIDPRSATSPVTILDRWIDRMNITVWTSYADYIVNASEIPEAESWVRLKFGNDLPSPELIRHRARQRLFYYHCMHEHKRESRGLTLLIDTDEFVRINYDTARRQLVLAKRLHNAPAAYKVPLIWEAGSVLTVVRQEQLLSPSRSSSISSSNITDSACIQIPRLRFGASVDSSQQFPPGPFNASAFATLKWHHHAAATNYQHNRISKTIVDLQLVDWPDLQPVESIHRPLQSCSRRKLHIRPTEQLLLIHHYIGSWSQYSFRKNDARLGNERSMAMYVNAAALTEGTSSDIVPWLGGFVQAVGLPEAQRLLTGVGDVSAASLANQVRSGKEE